MIKDYPGAKAASGVWQRIISEMPPHDCYIEPFLGSGIVYRRKFPAASSVLIDKDPAVITKWLPAISAESGDNAGLSVICGDGIRYLKERKWTGRELVYADPPYLLGARRGQRQIYRCEITTEAEHGQLLQLLINLPCPVMLSGYFTEFYVKCLPGWRTLTIPTMTHRGPVVEWVWCNFDSPTLLHDDRFIGRNFRERHRIKKRVKRWQDRLAKLPAVERAVLLSAMLRDPNAATGDGDRSAATGDGDRSAGTGVGIPEMASGAASVENGVTRAASQMELVDAKLPPP